jgi:D-amino-acid dehydrogenase
MKVAIVGGGVIGLGAAYELLKQGHQAVVIDAAQIGSGASEGNAGWVVPSDAAPVAAPGMILKSLKWMLHSDSPLYVKPSLNPQHVRFMLAMATHCNTKDYEQGFRLNQILCQNSVAEFDQYKQEGIDFEMHSDGLIYAHEHEYSLEKRIHGLPLIEEFGIMGKVVSGKEMSELEPTLLPSLAGGVVYEQFRHIRPGTFVAGLLKKCLELGLEVREHEEVVDVVIDKNVKALITTKGRIEADQYLIANGAHSNPLGKKFKTRIPVRPGKGYNVEFQPAPMPLKYSVNLTDAKVAVTPLNAGVRFAGTMEFAGLDRKINPARVEAIKNSGTRYFKDWDPKNTKHTAAWAGARPMTADGIPVIGKLPKFDNAWVSSGHGMYGITQVKGSSELIADLILGKPVDKQTEVFSPKRFN